MSESIPSKPDNLSKVISNFKKQLPALQKNLLESIATWEQTNLPAGRTELGDMYNIISLISHLLLTYSFKDRNAKVKDVLQDKEIDEKHREFLNANDEIIQKLLSENNIETVLEFEALESNVYATLEIVDLIESVKGEIEFLNTPFARLDYSLE